jgi:hypothetical protein
MCSIQNDIKIELTFFNIRSICFIVFKTFHFILEKINIYKCKEKK